MNAGLIPIPQNVSIKSGIKELGIFEKRNDAWVSSRDIAKLFDKEHKNVLRDIEDALSKLPDEFNQLNFERVKYKDKKGEARPEYLLNRKSFALIAMGFTGEKAMVFKVAYIEAFETMLTTIETRLLSKAGYKEMTSAIAKVYSNDPKNFSIEADMINECVLGMKAKDFRAVNQIDENGQTRDSVVQDKLDKLDKAQRFNAQLILGRIVFSERKSLIYKVFGGR